MERTCINHSVDPFAPVSYLHLEVALVEKDIPTDISQADLVGFHNIKDLSPDASLGSLVTIGSSTEADPNLCRLKITSTVPVVQEHPAEGWIQISNIVGSGDTARDGVAAAFTKLRELLVENKADISSLVRIILYIRDMSEYKEINEEYSSNFGINPPVRVCVALGKENFPPGN